MPARNKKPIPHRPLWIVSMYSVLVIALRQLNVAYRALMLLLSPVARGAESTCPLTTNSL